MSTTTFSAMHRTLAEVDPEIADAIRNEVERQNSGLELIASENFVSAAILEAAGSVLTNKYAEGYPGRRYYGGCEFVDVAESLAISRAKALFGAEHANVQPHAGAQANASVYHALLQPGDTIMGLALPHGGHLTHGWDVSATGKFWRAVRYEVDEKTHLIDYDRVRELARKERPRIIVAGATAYPREYDFKTFGEIAKEVDAYFLADISHISGLIIAPINLLWNVEKK